MGDDLDLGAVNGPALTVASGPQAALDRLSEVIERMEKTGLWNTDVEVWRLHYAKTLRHWYDRFMANRGHLKALMARPGVARAFRLLVMLTALAWLLVFTTGQAGWPGCAHIADRGAAGSQRAQKDFGPVIAKALVSDSPQELERGTIPIGFVLLLTGVTTTQLSRPDN